MKLDVLCKNLTFPIEMVRFIQGFTQYCLKVKGERSHSKEDFKINAILFGANKYLHKQDVQIITMINMKLHIKIKQLIKEHQIITNTIESQQNFKLQRTRESQFL